MTRKTVAIILVVVAVLALPGSMGAQPPRPDDSVDVSAELITLPCAVDLVSSGDFGTWTWDGAAWTSQSSAEVILDARLLYAPWNGCWITYRFGGLAGPGGTIDTSHFGLYLFYRTHRGDDAATDTRHWWASSIYRYYLVLESVPNVDPGDYHGVVEVSVANAV